MLNSQRIEQAIKDYQSGRDSDESFRLINEHYRPRLIRLFARRGFSSDRREDLTQETLLRVSKGMTDFRGGTSIDAFSAWVFQIAENVGRDHQRSWKTQKRDRHTVSLEDERGGGEVLSYDPPDPSPSSQPLEILLDQEHKRLLREAVERLPNQMRNCMKLHLYQERSNQEIAVLMGISIETVKAHLRQGKTKLKSDGVFD